MIKLGVNIDHVATLRQARLSPGLRASDEVYPDPLKAARICQHAGAHAIVMHLREDRRHIQDADLFKVKKGVSLKLNMEMSIADSVVRVADRLSPDQVTLVPEKRRERTTEGGLDLSKKSARLARCLKLFRRKNTPVSLFIDPDIRQVKEARRLDVDAVEFHTGDYANAATASVASKELERLKTAVAAARAMRLHVYAGHGLDYRNVSALMKIKGIEELNIGYAIVTRALWVGFENAVHQMLRLLDKNES